MTDTCNWKRLVDASGRPVEIQHGWSVADTFDLGNDVYLIALTSERHGDAGWIVRDGSVLVGGPTQIASNPDVRSALAESGIAKQVSEFIDRPDIVASYPISLSRLLAKYETFYVLIMSCIEILANTNFEKISPGDRNAAYMADGNLLHINSENALANPMWAGSDFARTIALGDAHIPAAIVGASLVVSRHVPISISPEGALPVYFSREGTYTAIRLAEHWLSEHGMTFLPAQNIIFHSYDDEGHAREAASATLKAYVKLLLTLDPALLPHLAKPTRGVALLLSGRAGGRHFGHAMLDELQALDRALTVEGVGAPIEVYHTTREGGADLFGPLGDLYPEVAGRVTCIKTPSDLVSDMLRRDLCVSYEAGRRVVRATRERIIAAVWRDARRSGLSAAAETIIGRGADRRTVLGIGLRLQNRCPTDFLGFCTRLTRAAVDRFGPLVVVIDGLNAPEVGDGSAATIYSAGNSQGQQISKGSTELEIEASFVAQYERSVKEVDVRTVNCVGMKIRPNLFWLDQCDYFVAPMGAGLAKFRWSLDKPGFVLSSAINIKLCNAYDIYSNEDYMEGPFSNLDYSTHDDVNDIFESNFIESKLKSFVPFPQNFTLNNEANLIDRILENMQSAKTKENNATPLRLGVRARG